MSFADLRVRAASRLSRAKRWLREPLLHFLVAGLALFAIYRMLHPIPEQPDEGNRIVITDDDLRQVQIAWRAQWQRFPTPDEMRGLVDSKIREEILYREAMALGLDKGDTIVKRRLAQKMEFLADDISSLREPADRRAEGLVRQEPGALRIAGLGLFSPRLLLAGPAGSERARRGAGRTAEACRRPFQ